MHWDFASVLDNKEALIAGAIGTVRLFAICLVSGLGFGLIVGLGRYARTRWFNWPATLFVEFFRNTPVLVQILWFYFALPIVAPFEISPRPRSASRSMRRHSRPTSIAAASSRSSAASGMARVPSA